MGRFNGDVGLAIRAYNAGPIFVERVKAGIYKDYPEETRDYVIKVLQYKEEYEGFGL